MFQLTDGTFRGERYCIHNHMVVEDGPGMICTYLLVQQLYTRIVPSHAIELTAALLDRPGRRGDRFPRSASSTRQQKRDLILSSTSAEREPARLRCSRVPPRAHQKCGDHHASSYLARVNGLKVQFARLAAGSSLQRLIKPADTASLCATGHSASGARGFPECPEAD